MLVAPPHAPPESITVALSSVFDGAGPHQRRTTGLGFVVAQSYETLLGVDCRQQLYPRLARSWSSEVVAHGRRWTITLRDEARFWNGDRVTASDVLAAWRSTSDTPNGDLARLLAAATTVIDDRTLSVTLADSTPRILVHPSLAVRASTAPPSAASRVRVRSIDATAARDALDAGADLLVSDDPGVVSYATNRDELLTLSLPWDRTYVVLASEMAPPDVSATLRLTVAGLLVGAVRSDFRSAQGPFWWESSHHCTTAAATRPVAPARTSFRVVYLSGDRVAEGIAERLVALAGSRSARGEDEVGTLLPRLSQVRMGATAAALLPSAFAAALHAGDELAYVLPLPRFTVAPCHEFAMLLRAAPWLEPARLQVVPLIDTRNTAIVRPGRVGLAVDADGSLRLLDGASPKTSKP